MNSLGERLAYARNVRGLSQNRLARESGVSLSTINQLEKAVRGKRTGSEVVTKLANALAVHRAWLEAGIGPRDIHDAVSADRYPNRAQAVRAARELAMSEDAIAQIESMTHYPESDPPAEWWMGKLVDAGRELRDPLLVRGRKMMPQDVGDDQIAALETLLEQMKNRTVSRKT